MDLEHLDQTKHRIDDIFTRQKASPAVKMRLKTLHAKLMKRLNSRCIARTHSKGFTYLLLNDKNIGRAIVFLDVRRNFLTLRFYTDGGSIDGLRKANWHAGGDCAGSEPYRVDSDESQERAIVFALAAQQIAEALR